MAYSKKKLIKLVDEMPAFPPSIYRILKLTADINCEPKDLVRVIDLDPVLTLKLLQLVNSPYFGLSRQISSIKQAVVFVGINTMKNLALTIAPLEMLSGTINDAPFMESLRAHAIGVGVIAKHLARRIGISEVESTDFFVAGLLHDFGKIALFRFTPEAYKSTLDLATKKKITLLQAEQELLGVTHTKIGAMLGHKWRLPVEFVTCMGQHHTRDTTNATALQDCIYTANIVAKKIGIGHSGNSIIENSLPKAIENRLECKLPELIGTLGDLSGEMNQAQIFIHP